MTIRCQCTGCSARFEAPDAWGGKAVRCPKCKAAIRLPGAKREPAPQAARKSGAAQGPAWFARDTDGRHHGPMSKVELDRLVAADQLDGLCQIRRADWEDWRWIETVYEQFADADEPDASVANADLVQTELAEAAGPRLEECPDCGKIVSRRATQCPNCGCPIAVGGSLRTRDVEAREHHGSRRRRMGKAVFLAALVAVLILFLAGSGYLCLQLWQRAHRPIEIPLPIFSEPASVAPSEPVAAPIKAATPAQITAWIDEIAALTARRLDAGYRQMHLAQSGIAAMQEQAELLDSLVSGEFAKSAKHDKPKRPPPPPYQSRYEPLCKECAEYLRKTIDPKTASHAAIAKQAASWADAKRSPMQKALEAQLGVPRGE